MTDFHLMHVIPHPTLHGLNGYKEIIDSVAWGLVQLGHRASYAINGYDPSVTNILFGSQMLPLEIICELPDNSILYNLEQVRNLDPRNFTEAQQLSLERFEIWEYSTANLPAWRALANRRVKLVPIGYAPVLDRIPKPATQDIDVLLFGMSGPTRMRAVHQLSTAGITVVYVSGVYGEARDQLIARSKLVLNVHVHDHSQIFEVARVSYLFANRKAVVAVKGSQTFVEADIAAAVHFTTLEQLVAECRRLLDDEAGRVKMEKLGHEVMMRRDVRVILAQALSDN